MFVFDLSWFVTVVPFTFLVFNYFNKTIDCEPSLFVAFLKILPIIWLTICVKYWNKLNKSTNYLKITEYQKYIFNGLLAAIIGDVCLVWPQNTFSFTIGVLFFCLTHCFYIKALGFRPIKVELLLIYCLPIALLNLIIMFNQLKG